MEGVDSIVIGAGVIGLGIARALAIRGHEVLILERHGMIGAETSSRNSEVIHAGLYYPPGSLKARLCQRGRDMLYDYAARHHVPHRRCGKLIVATSAAQVPTLEAIRETAARQGVTDLCLLSADEARALEPALACHGALLSPSTGIIDSHALMLSLLGDAETAGATLSLTTEFLGARAGSDGLVVETRDAAGGVSFSLACKRLVNAAGLYASDVARRVAGLDPRQIPETGYARGNYFSVTGRSAFERLIYPVPEPGGLGVHLTLDLGGGMRFGPDVEWIDRVDYRVSDKRRAHFDREIRKYWPALPQDALQPTYCGIRPKLSGPGEPAADFRIEGPTAHGVPGLLNCFGIESPGLTSALAIAELAADLIAPR